MKRFVAPFVVVLLFLAVYAGKSVSDDSALSERDRAITDIIINENNIGGYGGVGLYGMCAAKDQQMNFHCAVYQVAIMKKMELADRYCCVYPLTDKEFKQPEWITCPPGDTEKNERNPMLEFLPSYFTSYWSSRMDRLETISSDDAVKEMVKKSFPGCVAGGSA